MAGRTAFLRSPVGNRLRSPLGAFVAKVEPDGIGQIVLYVDGVIQSYDFDGTDFTAVGDPYDDAVTLAGRDSACLAPNRLAVMNRNPSESSALVTITLYDFGGASFGWGPVAGDSVIDYPGGTQVAEAALLAGMSPTRLTGYVMGTTGYLTVLDYDNVDWTETSADDNPAGLGLFWSFPYTIPLSGSRIAAIRSGAGIYTLQYNETGPSWSLIGTPGFYPGDWNLEWATAMGAATLALILVNNTTDVVILTAMRQIGGTWTEISTPRTLTSDLRNYAVAALSESRVVVYESPVSASSVGPSLAAFDLIGTEWTLVGNVLEVELAGSTPKGLFALDYRMWAMPSPEALTMGAVIPNIGDPDGGSLVAVTGSGFTPSTTVEFNGEAATSVTFVNSRTLTCVTPGASPSGFEGLVDVEVFDGMDSSLREDAYEYGTPPAPPLTVISVSPNSGTAAGGTAVTITGTGFTADCVVAFLSFPDFAPATSVVFVNDTTITCVTPAWTPGPAVVDVGVVDTVTSESDILVNGYTYT